MMSFGLKKTQWPAEVCGYVSTYTLKHFVCMFSRKIIVSIQVNHLHSGVIQLRVLDFSRQILQESD